MHWTPGSRELQAFRVAFRFVPYPKSSPFYLPVSESVLLGLPLIAEAPVIDLSENAGFPGFPIVEKPSCVSEAPVAAAVT